MNNGNSRKVSYDYDKLKDETNYHCNGNQCCTCKFLNDRTEYDRLQYSFFVDSKQKNNVFKKL